MKKLLLFSVVFLLFLTTVAADDEYKPYLHKATVPEHPEVRLFGKYSTSMFPGAATYSYGIEVAKGTNGLSPSLAISYNSQSVKQRPGVLGAGWSLTPSYVYRDVNFTVGDESDDKFILILEGTPYELVYNPNDNKWHTEVEYHYKVENYSGYWLLTKKNGIKYKFNYTLLNSKWYLGEVEDTYGNKVFYSYLSDPYAEDTNAVYLDKIEYNNFKTRKIEFKYESTERPDLRLVYDQGVEVQESRRLTDVSVYASSDLVRRYNFDYITLNPALTSVSKISYYGSDNVSVLHNISFSYFSVDEGFTKETSTYTPPVLFSNDAHDDYGARLVDFNSDGYVDIVRRKGADNKAWVNDKNGNWTEDSSWQSPVEIVSGSTDKGVRFADVNYDGYPDLLKSSDGTRQVYLNNKTGWNLSGISIPIDFVDSSGNDLGVRLADVDGDGKIDIIKAKSTKTVYLNNGNGWTSSSWSFPEDFVDGSYLDRGIRLIDLNGDGLVDVLKGKSGSSRLAWLNNGTGWNSTSVWIPPTDFAKSDSKDNGVRFLDVNGDGLVDMVEDSFNGTAEKGAWINTGSGWQSDSTWESPEAFTKDGYNIGRRLADIDGDGFVDIIVSHQDSSKQYVWIKNWTTPYMLSSVVNEYGGNTTVNYTKSTQFNNSEAGYSEIGFNIFVVSNVSADNGLSNGFNVSGGTSYSYAFGKYNYDKNEFRGFGKATEISDSKKVDHYFYQDDPRRGKEYKTEVYDVSGMLYSKNLKDYNWTLDNGIYNLSLLFSTDYVYDGNSSDPLVTNKSYLYDGFENLREIIDYGDVSVSGDEKHIEYSYAYGATPWIMNKVASEIVYDANDLRIKDTRYYYDDLGFEGMGSLGSLTKVEKWNSEGNNSYTYYSYDDYGNVIEETDSLGHSTKFTYDSTYTYPSSVVNALGHIMYYSYDLGTGNLLWQEKNNIRKSYTYDVFGRVSKEIMPYDTSESPTKSYTYTFDGVAPESVKVSLKTTADNTYDIRYYYDGVGNLVQLKTDFDSLQVVKNLFYDSDFRVSYEQNPYFSSYSTDLSSISSTENYTYYVYDALDRVIAVINPDGSVKNVTFDRYNVVDYDENGNKHKYTLDGLGRIVSVTEYNVNDVGISEEYVTNYEYDRNDNLVEITDAVGNEFKFGYDSLGRKISMNDPDLGNWTYSYDKAGNLISQYSGGGSLITGDGYYREYNELNQLVRIRNGSTASLPILEEYWYNQDGIRIKTKKYDNANTTIYTPFREMMRVVNSTGTYDYTYVYQGSTLVARKNPDGSVYNYHPDHLGSTTILTNSTGGIIEETDYTPYGEVDGSTPTTETRIGYTGQESDEDTGQVYMKARYYKPELGMFVQADKVIPNVFDPQQINRYSYARNNPLKFVDSSGNAIEPASATIITGFVVTGLAWMGSANVAAKRSEFKNLPKSEYKECIQRNMVNVDTTNPLISDAVTQGIIEIGRQILKGNTHTLASSGVKMLSGVGQGLAAFSTGKYGAELYDWHQAEEKCECLKSLSISQDSNSNEEPLDITTASSENIESLDQADKSSSSSIKGGSSGGGSYSSGGGGRMTYSQWKKTSIGRKTFQRTFSSIVRSLRRQGWKG